ncbi:hypothetical protein ACFLZL_03700, partial [Thermodesulfobacteriota bacterium]
QTGERWDVTQAESIGFEPRRFQYGIGRFTFRTLDNTHLKPHATGLSKKRIIGVSGKTEAHAYSVAKLQRHEIANTNLEDKPIAVGY